MKKEGDVSFGVLFGVIVIAGILFNIFLFSDSSESKAVASNTTVTQKEVIKTEEPPKSNWTHTVHEDKMRNEKRDIYRCTSKNSVDFDFPYNGGSYLSIVVRNWPDSTDVLVSISKGQILTFDKDITVKFDNGELKKYPISSVSSGSAELAYVENSEDFLANLKQSKAAMIEVEFYNSGNKQFVFDTAGL